jgi:hypothetical protein
MKEWTIMIYMAGDNNLAVDMAYAMEQIKAVPAQGEDSPNLFVYYDGNSPAIPTLYCDFSESGKPRYVRSYKVPNKLYPIVKKENENAADPRSIVNFVDWCVNSVEVDNKGEISYGRRSQKYALIFSGHSLGFQDIGLFKDETSGKAMSMKDFYAVLERLTGCEEELVAEADENKYEDELREIETKVLIGQPLDILGFDSCVMGMLEVGYQFNNMTRTIIASEGSVPSAGWTYAKILGCLATGNTKDVDTKEVAALFVKQFVRSQDAYTVGGVSVDMAAWDLIRFGPLASEFDGLAVILLDCFKDPASRIYRQMERVILKVHWKCQSYMYDQNVDLGDFCELLDKECETLITELSGNDIEILRRVQYACRRILQELKKAVILSGFSGGGYQYSNGVSVFFPWSRESYEVSRKNYESLWFTKEAKQKRLSWTGFLKKYLYEVSLRRFEPPAEEIHPERKYRYYSGVKFDERDAAYMTAAVSAGATKIAGQEGSKIAGQEGSKIAGQEGSKIAGQEGSKLGGGGSSAFFNSLRLFKNIESRWNVSGFSKKPDDDGHSA